VTVLVYMAGREVDLAVKVISLAARLVMAG